MIHIADQALSLLKKAPDPYKLLTIDTTYIIPIQWLYVELVKNKDLKPLSELDRETKQKLWNMVKDVDRPQYVKIWTCQVLYLMGEIEKGNVK